MDRKAAAEARRQKLLARGSDRLKQVTGTIAPPAEEAAAAPALQEDQPTSTAPPAGEQPPALPPAAAGPSGAAAPAATASAHSLPRVPSGRKVGAAASEERWSDYAAPSATAHSQRHLQLQPRAEPTSAAHTLAAAVRATATTRLLLAAAFALLLSVAWDVQAGAAQQPAQAAAPAGASVLAAWAGLASKWQQRLGERWQALVSGGAHPPVPAPATPSASEAVSAVLGQACAALQRLPGAAYDCAAQLVQSPAVATALPQLQRLPPLVALVLLDLALLAAAAVALAAAGRVGPPPRAGRGLLPKLASLVPGLPERLAGLSAAVALVAGLMNDTAVFLLVLIGYRVLPGEAEAWIAGR